MKELTLKQLAAWCGGEIHPDGADAAVTGTQIDSRLIRKGDLFVAIPGEKVDGHDFISKAREAGAAAALVSRVVDDPLPQILVVDTVLAYGDIARAYREAAGVDVVAITGSVGKTTTKEMIACVLAGKYRVSKTQGNHNNNLGLPITIFEMPADTQEAVLELGMNHFGEMHYLTTIAKPNIVVITNIGTMHIEHLGTREGILKAKLEIMDGIQDDGVAVFNGDEPLLWNLREGKHRRIYFGIENDQCDVVAEDVRQMDGGMYFVVRGMGQRFHVYVPQEGQHTVYNALAAIAVGLLRGVSPETIQYQLGIFHNTGMRQRIFEEKGFTIIEDCYNAGPESMEAYAGAGQPHHGRTLPGGPAGRPDSAADPRLRQALPAYHHRRHHRRHEQQVRPALRRPDGAGQHPQAHGPARRHHLVQGQPRDADGARAGAVPGRGREKVSAPTARN